jgi:hypothetical protein
MLGEAFGPGDLAFKINEFVIGWEVEPITIDQANQLMDWMAAQISAEEEDGESGQGPTS